MTERVRLIFDSVQLIIKQYELDRFCFRRFEGKHDLTTGIGHTIITYWCQGKYGEKEAVFSLPFYMDGNEFAEVLDMMEKMYQVMEKP